MDIPTNIDNIADKEFLGTLAKGLSVITAFGDSHPTLTVSEAARLADLSRATARRILHTLHVLGYVEQNDREFSLSPKTLELGFGFLAAQSWIERATALLRELSEDVEESSSASILQGTDIVYVAHVPSRRLMSVDETVGTRLTALHSAMGRVQLGYLDETELWRRLKSVRITPYTASTITNLNGLYDRIRADHEQGFSIVDEELEKGLRSIAVAVHGRDGQLRGSISLSVNSTRATRENMRTLLLPKLQGVADKISASLSI